MAYLIPSKVTKPTTTTLRDISEADFGETEKQVLEFMEEAGVPVIVHPDTETDGYVDISVGDTIDIAAISIYHLKGWTKYSLPQEDSIIYGVNTGDLDD